MGGCATQIFTNVTQQRFNCLVAKAAAAGITINGNSGQATQSGVTIRWAFDPVAQTLEFQCMSAPFLVPCGIINSKVHDLVDSCP